MSVGFALFSYCSFPVSVTVASLYILCHLSHFPSANPKAAARVGNNNHLFLIPAIVAVFQLGL